MSYIKREKVEVTKLVCHHPRVKKMWEWGGAGINPTSSIMSYISFILDNDERVDISDEDFNKTIEKAEKYLETL